MYYVYIYMYVYIGPYSIFRPPHFFHTRLYTELRGVSHFPTTPHLPSACKTTIQQSEAIFLLPLLGPVLLSSCLGCLLARCSVLVFRFLVLPVQMTVLCHQLAQYREVMLRMHYTLSYIPVLKICSIKRSFKSLWKASSLPISCHFNPIYFLTFNLLKYFTETTEENPQFM